MNRRAWQLIAAAYALLALGTVAAIWLSVDTAQDQDAEIALSVSEAASKATEAQQTGAEAQESSDDVVAFLRGESGIDGVPGADGEDGSPGQPGSAGVEGRGPAGAQGPPGPAGPAAPAVSVQPGPAGATGPAGMNGDPGPRGPAGEPGARGPGGADGSDGAAGAPGAPGAPAVLATSVAFAASVNDPSDDKQQAVACAAGRATGGGYALVPNDPGIIVTASAPNGNTGWSVTATELSLPVATSWQLLVFAVCAG